MKATFNIDETAGRNGLGQDKAEVIRNERPAVDHMGVFLNNDKPGQWDVYGPYTREQYWG